MVRSPRLRLLPGRFALYRFAPDARIPEWALSGGDLCSVTRTAAELSIVCPERAAPAEALCEAGWRAFEVEGPLDFALTGILASILAPLAEAGVSIFAVSTYNTDYVLVKEVQLEDAVCALERAGRHVDRPTHPFV